ncbi:MAG: hypothetical protein ABS46_03560 [Cytophagaceae bacterium SCN 52-12]|nr:MAG: hypothetical protein ABS46_03560 [Cytophagaceae bacterium SCN 52-12]
MKTLSLWMALVMGIVSAAYAQESRRTFDLKDFDKLSVGSAFKANVSKSNSFRVVATGEQQDLDDLEAKISGRTLVIKYKNSRNRRKGVTLDIEMPALAGVDLSGAASMKAAGFNGGNDLKLDVSGAAKLALEIEAGDVSFDLSGASSTMLTGSARSLKGDISGASSLKASDFPVKDAEVDASGASSATVHPSSRLLAEASGASSIRYAGGAKDIRVNTSGGSSVKKSD